MYKNEVKRVCVDSGVADSCVLSDINTVQRACADTESLVSSKVQGACVNSGIADLQ